MINFIDIYNSVRNAIIDEFPSAYVTATYNRVPPVFPCVWINEIDRYSPKGSISINNNELIDYSTVEIQVFAKSYAEVERITSITHGAMRNRWYICDSRKYVPNDDETIFRIVGRYHRIIGGADEE